MMLAENFWWQCGKRGTQRERESALRKNNNHGKWNCWDKAKVGGGTSLETRGLFFGWPKGDLCRTEAGAGQGAGSRGRRHWSSDYANCMATGNYEWQKALPRAKVRGRKHELRASRCELCQVARLGSWQVAVADEHKTKLPIQFWNQSGMKN